MKHIVGLCGYPQSGKDTFAKVLTQDYGFERIAFADPLRESALVMNPYIPAAERRLHDIVKEHGWETAKAFREVRRLLQVLGTECGRDIFGADCWCDIVKKKIKSTKASVVITDVRFHNEVQLVKVLGGTLLHIERPGYGPINGHASEALKYDIVCDGTISNNGTEQDLIKVAGDFAQSLLGWR